MVLFPIKEYSQNEYGKALDTNTTPCYMFDFPKVTSRQCPALTKLKGNLCEIPMKYYNKIFTKFLKVICQISTFIQSHVHTHPKNMSIAFAHMCL